MHQDERGKYAIGEPGGAIGAYGTQYNRDGATSAISPAIVIEWDTRKCLLAELVSWQYEIWHQYGHQYLIPHPAST